MTKIYALIAGLLLLVACGHGNVLTEGTVIEKQYSPGYNYMDHYCAAYHPKYFYCMAWIPEEKHMAPVWKLHIEGVNDDGKSVNEWHRIGEGEFDRYDTGDHWPRG